MVSPLDGSHSIISTAVREQILAEFPKEWTDRLDIDQMFVLIDGVLPFEACLYYQVLPMSLDGSLLNLGMVSPEDAVATEYVRRIVSYLNYGLVPCPISTKALQVTLTTYLNCGGQQSTSMKQSRMFGEGAHRSSIRTRAEQELDMSLQPTLLLENTEEAIDENLGPILPDADPLPMTTAQSFTSNQSGFCRSETPDQGDQTVAQVAPSLAQTPRPLPPLINPLPVLHIQAPQQTVPIDQLAGLPPKALVQELLGRVLQSGIGRLYFGLYFGLYSDSQAAQGRIGGSLEGVLQATLEQVPIATLQTVIAEFKHLVQLPSQPTPQPQYTEMEYFYERSRVLLRFQVMPGAHGEEATLQVLRGAALKFYQQQQLSKLERDALSIAKQLQNKLSEIRDRARTEPGLLGGRFEMLPNLVSLLHTMEDQVRQITKIEEQ